MADIFYDIYGDIYAADEVLYFTPPTVEQRWETGEWITTLFSKQPRGLAVIQNGAVFTEKRFPSQTELAAADAYWLGGRRHLVSDSQAADLINAGYEDYIEGLVFDEYTANYGEFY